MGCDGHFYIQYKKKTDNFDDWWFDFGGEISPGRNYLMFGILAGVRDRTSRHFEPKGILPEKKQSWAVREALYLMITEDGKGCRETTLENAKRFARESDLIKDEKGKPIKVLDPDWHSHSWLTIKELETAFKWYKKYADEEIEGSKVPFEYKVILKVMKILENKGKNDVLLVFWFDN